MRNRATNVVFVISLMIVFAIAVYTVFAINTLSSYLAESIQARLMIESREAASLASAEELGQLDSTDDMASPTFRGVRERLARFADEHIVEHVYFGRILGNEMHWIVDDGRNEAVRSDLSSATAVITDAMRQAYGGTTTASDFVYSSSKGGVISSFSPVRDSSGAVVAIVGVDDSDTQAVEYKRASNYLTYLLVASVIAVFICGCISIVLQSRREKTLGKRLREQHLLSTVSQVFVSPAPTDQLVCEALKATAEAFGLNAVQVVSCPADGAVSVKHSWYARAIDEVSHDKTDVGRLARELFAAEIASAQDVISIPCDDTAMDHNGLFKSFASAGVTSMVISPLYVGVRLWGVVLYMQKTTWRVWTEDDLRVLDMVSVTTANAVNRDTIDRERVKNLDHAIEASQAKSDFLSNMSHEIRTPMNAIIGMATIARSSSDPAQVNHCLDMIDEASNHLLSIINDVLDMSKIEASKLELVDVAFDLRSVIAHALAVLDVKIKERGQRLVVNIDDKVPQLIWGDDRRLTQILVNLVSNANKFTPDDGTITIKADLGQKGGGVNKIRFEVSDTGIGISDEQKARLFNSFEQAEHGTSRKYGGTGLGLAISKRIVEMMGGRIWIESELGQGAHFFFTIKARTAQPSDVVDQDATPKKIPIRSDNPYVLSPGATPPAVDAEAPSALTATAGQDDACFRGATILIVEDVEINREVVLAFLEPTEARLRTASNGIEALDMFASDPDGIDIILMDIQMPEMDGLETTRQIRALGTEQARDVPIIAMTANVFSDDIDKCLDAGMDGHIGKPINYYALIETLHKWLRR